MVLITYNNTRFQYYFNYIIEHCILAVAFFLPLSVHIATGFLMTGLAAWFGKMAVTRNFTIKRSPFDGLIAVFVLLAAASIFASPDRYFSFYNYYHLMGRYIAVYYLVVNHIHSIDQLKRLAWAIFASAAVVTFYGFYQYLHGVDISNLEWVDDSYFPELKIRVFSTLQNPNLLAGFLVMIMALACGFGCKAQNITGKLVFSAVFAVMAVCLALTYSRGAWVSLVCVLALCGVLFNKKMLWLLLLVPIAIWLTNGIFTERIISIFNPADTSSTLRIALWESTIMMITDRPLLGSGWGSYWLVYPQYDFFIQNAETTIFHAHNMYLNIAAEIGIPGLLFFLAIIFGHIRAGWTVLRTVEDPALAGLLLGLLLALFSLIIGGFTDFIMFNIQLSMLFWLFLAMLMVIWQQCGRKIRNCRFKKQ